MNMKNKIREFFTLTRKGKGGFTLVELIVVIAILGILAGVAIPVYNGYIKKADNAGDEQLLAVINKAFISACLENAVDISDVTATRAQLKIDDATKTVDVENSKLVNETVKASFAEYFGENSSAKFKVATTNDIIFDEDAHMFKINLAKVTVTFGDYEFSISQKLAAALGADHSFQSIGADTLLSKVDKVSDIAGSLVGALDDEGELNMTNTFNKVVFGSEEYLANLQETLDLNDEDFAALVMNDDGTWKSDVLANSLVLTAAQKTQGMDTSFLGETGSAATLRAQLNDPATATDAMAKLALTYGMYTAYVQTNPDMEDKSEELLEQGNFQGMTNILAEIESEEFRTYLASEQGQKDLDAYMASMQIVNDSANQSSEATQDILTKGFTDQSLVGALGNLMGN